MLINYIIHVNSTSSKPFNYSFEYTKKNLRHPSACCSNYLIHPSILTNKHICWHSHTHSIVGDSLERRQIDMWLLAYYEYRAPPPAKKVSHDSHLSNHMTFRDRNLWHRWVGQIQIKFVVPSKMSFRHSWEYRFWFGHFMCIFVYLWWAARCRSKVK